MTALPDIWTSNIRENLLRNNWYLRTYDLYNDEWSRKDHEVIHQIPEDKLAERAQRYAEWRKLTDELLADDVLEHCNENG